MFVRIRESRVKVLLALLMALAVLGACGGGDDDAANDSAAEDTAGDSEETPEGDDASGEAADGTLQFHATEYAFSVSETVPAGQVSLEIVNKGEEPHMLDLVPLVDDAPPVEDLIKLGEKEVGKFFKGQPIHVKTVKAGETSKAVPADLEPGRYGYVCFYAKKGEEPHAFKGMYGELTVE